MVGVANVFRFYEKLSSLDANTNDKYLIIVVIQLKVLDELHYPAPSFIPHSPP